MSAKSERLLSLVVLLRGDGWVTRRSLRRRVPEYRDAPTEDAFQRMFERDKAELRDLGLPIDTGPPGAQGEDLGYRIREVEYDLPDLAVDEADLTVLALAARAWQDATLAGQARLAASKLGVDAVDDAPSADRPLDPDIRLPAAGEGFEDAVRALRERRLVAFDYRGSQDRAPRHRQVAPWALTARGGSWYLVGLDQDAQAVRAFRTSRIQGRLRAVGAAQAFDRPDREILDPVLERLLGNLPAATASLAVEPGHALPLRRRATTLDSGTAPGGWDVIEVPMADEDALAADVVATGGSAVALAPETLVERVRTTLAAVLAALEEPS
jgi:proteasome accessory factor B